MFCAHKGLTTYFLFVVKVQLMLFFIIQCTFSIQDMMPALHNYITVDTEAFLANPTYLEVIYDMCKTVSAFELT